MSRIRTMDECAFSVRVEIVPLWIRPAELLAQEAGRRQAEARFAWLAAEVAGLVRAKLDQMQRDYGDDPNQWVLPMRLADGSWFPGGET